MTRFLRADGIRDDIQGLREALEGLAEMVRQRQAVSEHPAEESRRMEDLVAAARRHLRSMSGLLDAFPCAPLIYTGNEDTEDVIMRLEHLLERAADR